MAIPTPAPLRSAVAVASLICHPQATQEMVIVSPVSILAVRSTQTAISSRDSNSLRPLPGASGSIGTGDITISPAATRNNNAAGGLSTALYLNRTGTYSLVNNISLGGNANVANINNIAAGNPTLSGVISGDGQLYNETGNMTLSGVNTYTGRTTIFNGTVEIRNNMALGAAGDVNAGWSWVRSFDGTTEQNGSLVLSNGINSAEFVWVSSRLSSNLTPHIINKSGHNTLSGQITSDFGGTDSSANYKNVTLQSDGTML